MHIDDPTQRATRGTAESPLPIVDPRRTDGAFMEPSGRNRWQPVANETHSNTAQIDRSATGRNPRQRFRSAWQGGGRRFESSEGSAKAPHARFLVQSDCSLSNVR